MAFSQMLVAKLVLSEIILSRTQRGVICINNDHHITLAKHTSVKCNIQPSSFQ